MGKQFEYQVTVDQPGKRWKVIHNLSDGGSVAYFVRVGLFNIECNCPSYRYHKQPCKHCRFVSGLIGKPELVEPAAF